MNAKQLLEKSYNDLAPLSNKWRKEFRRHKYTLGLLKEYIPDFKDKRILDVGCGIGVLLYAFNNMGAKADGVDRDILEEWGIEGIEKLWEEKNINIITKDFFDMEVADETYDIVISENVFEHLKYTHKEFLEKINKALRPGGYLFLATPNIASFLKRFRLMAGRSPYWDLKDFFINKQPYGHTREFSATELKQMAKWVGFEAVDVDFYNVYIKGKWVKMPKRYPSVVCFLLSLLFRRGSDELYLVAKKR